MTHSSNGFADHFMTLLKNTGPSGPTGPSVTKPLNASDKSGTTQGEVMGPVENEWSQQCAATGPSKNSKYQSLSKGVTAGTSGTTTFAGAAAESDRGDTPAEWHAILAVLERRNCPDWLSSERWEWLLADAENLLTRWGSAAHALGWTELDLFGAHPIVPAARYDTMGLLLLIQNGAVVALTANIATIRRPSGATMSFRRLDLDVPSVLLPSVLA